MERSEWIEYIKNNVDEKYIETEDNSIFLDYVEGQGLEVLCGFCSYYLSGGISLDYNGNFINE